MTIDQATDPATLGLRERKRLATRRAIQVAVLELVSERGLDGVTVDEVSRVADVSPRTFFNYFASKEEAMLGDAPELPADHVIDEFVAATGHVIDDLAIVLMRASDKSTNDLEMMRLRHGLLKEYPQLFAARMATMRAFEESVSEIVTRRLLREDPTLDDAAVANRSRLITLVAFATMRHAWTCWASSDLSTLPDRLAESFGELRDLYTSETV